MPAARVAALGKCFKDKKIKRIKLDGLVGSAPSVVFSQLPRLKQPYLAVANDMDEAGYLYNDLCQILGEQAALLFPSGYKRDIKYGQEDAPSQILRAEVLSRWDDPQLRVVVTYPEALAEKVAMRQQLIDSTLSFRRGGTADLTATAQRLRDFGFVTVDYVYEPGQFAVRGSILDIFSFTNEQPYRIDFFGDDIESIRTFNIETQLSERSVDEITVVNNLSTGAGGGESLLRFAGADTVLLIHDREWLRQRVRAVAEETLSESALIAEEGDKHAMDNVVDAEQFCCDIDSHRYADYAVNNRGDYDAALASATKISTSSVPRSVSLSRTATKYTYFPTASLSLNVCALSSTTERTISASRRCCARFMRDLSTTSAKSARLPTIRFLNASISTRSRATVCVRASWRCR